MNSSYIWSMVWAGITTTASIVIYQPFAAALSSQEVAKIADTITVQVNQSDPQNRDQSSGSGFIISKQGNRYTVLTCDHVWNDENHPGVHPAKIRTADGNSYPILSNQSLKSSGGNDLALLTFESSSDYPTAKFGDSDQATLGAAIFVYGFPVDKQTQRGGENRFAQFAPGYITSRLPQEAEGYTIRYNAPTGSGMSGGPVLDIDGRVIGVHGQGLEDTQTVQAQSGELLSVHPKTGINAAIPVKTYLGLQSQLGGQQVAVDTHPSSDRPTERLQNPDSAGAFDARAQIRESQGDQNGALSDFNQAISMDATSASAFFHRADLRYRQGDRQGAFQDYSQAIALNPSYANAYFNRAVVRNGLGDKVGAVQDFTIALNFDPFDILAYYSRGIVRRTLQDAAGTFADFDMVVRLAPNRYEAYYNRALAWAMLGNRENAVADLTQALTLNPRYTQAYIDRALTRRRLGDREGAIQDLSYVLSYEPNNATAQYNRGIFRRDSGDRQGAIDDLQQAVVLFQRGGDTGNYHKAIEVLQRLQSSPVPTAPAAVPNQFSPASDSDAGAI